jgi:hypothetical protein
MDTRIETAKRRIVEARAGIFVQEKLIARLAGSGQGLTTARETLDLLRRALMVFEAEYEAVLLTTVRAPEREKGKGGEPPATGSVLR